MREEEKSGVARFYFFSLLCLANQFSMLFSRALEDSFGNIFMGVEVLK